MKSQFNTVSNALMSLRTLALYFFRFSLLCNSPFIIIFCSLLACLAVTDTQWWHRQAGIETYISALQSFSFISTGLFGKPVGKTSLVSQMNAVHILQLRALIICTSLLNLPKGEGAVTCVCSGSTWSGVVAGL